MVFSPFYLPCFFISLKCVIWPPPSILWFRTRKFSNRMYNIVVISTRMRVGGVGGTAIHPICINIIVVCDLR